MADIFGWYDDLLQSRYAPQSQPPDLLANQAFPQAQPAQTYQTAPDTIPLNTDMTRPDTGGGTYWDNARQAAGDIYRAGAGVAERFNKGTMNMLGLRAPGAPMYQGEIDVGPGMARLGDAATFASGGLTSTLSPVGTFRAGAQYAVPAAREAGRDALPMLQGVLSDEAGVMRMSQAQRRRAMMPAVAEGPAPAGAPVAAAEPALVSPMVGHNRPPALGFPQAKFPQYAEAYPEAGPPTPTLKDIKDPSKGLYDEKTPTPEAAVFVKERNKIMADMKKKGYTPYFDPEARYYVDPSNYPSPNVDTSTVGVKKPDAVARYAAVIDQPETKQAIRDAYARGTELGNAEHWYAMGQLEKAYTDELGPQAGRAAYLDEFAVPLSATTSGNKPINNFLMAHYMEYLRKNNLPVPEEAHQLPYPIGGRRANVNLQDYARMRAKGGFSGFGAGQPKMLDFTMSNLGDLSHAVIDEQMAGGSLKHAPGWADKARTGAYGQLQRPVHEVAAEMNVERARQGLPPLLPGNVQDVAWAGFKGEPGQPLISVINDSIERTHRLTGMPKEEIVRRGLVRKEIPMYGLLGAIGLGAAARGQSDQY